MKNGGSFHSLSVYQRVLPSIQSLDVRAEQSAGLAAGLLPAILEGRWAGETSRGFLGSPSETEDNWWGFDYEVPFSHQWTQDTQEDQFFVVWYLEMG